METVIGIVLIVVAALEIWFIIRTRPGEHGSPLTVRTKPRRVAALAPG